MASNRVTTSLGFRLIVALSALTGVLAPTVPAFAQARTGPDSFLAREVRDVSSLIAELKRDPSAVDRFAKHFRTSKEAVQAYFANNLRIKHLPRAAKLTVWGHSLKRGSYPVAQSFAKGTAVFALDDGTPILKYGCGNPLLKQLPPIISVPATQPGEPLEPEMVAPKGPQVVEPRGEPTAAAPSPAETELALLPLAPGIVEEEIAGLAQLAFIPSAVAGGGALPLLGLIPIGVAAGGGGGGYVIPEPCFTHLLGLVVLTFGARSLAKRLR